MRRVVNFATVSVEYLNNALCRIELAGHPDICFRRGGKVGERLVIENVWWDRSIPTQKSSPKGAKDLSPALQRW